MSRHRPGKSYSHRIRYQWGEYELSWTVDFYYPSSRLRFPRRVKRWTDYNGAERFAKKHGVDIPSPNDTEESK